MESLAGNKLCGITMQAAFPKNNTKNKKRREKKKEKKREKERNVGEGKQPPVVPSCAQVMGKQPPTVPS
jgi:hypothetical protein